MRIAVLSAAAIFAVPLVAQQAPDTRAPGLAPEIQESLFDSCNAWWDQGRLHAGGSFYQAELTDGSLELLPILGSEAPHNLPWRYSLGSIQRGGEVLAEAGVGQPQLVPAADGRCAIRVPRAEGITEVFHLTPGGVEITYELAQRPRGTGDLVVSGEVRTDMVGRLDPEGGLTYSLPGDWPIAGDVLTVGGVTGVAADGQRVAGALVWRKGELTMSLPGRFLDRAAYPVVLDPFVGTTQDVSVLSFDDSEPDLAFALNADAMLVVYRRVISNSSSVIRAQRYNQTSFAQNGGLIGVSPVSATWDERPAVGYIASSARYVVAWSSRPQILGFSDIKARGVDPLTGGTTTNVVTVSNSPSQDTWPDISSEIRTTGNAVTCIWLEEGVGLKASQLSVSAINGTVASGGVLTVVNDPNAERPRIAKSGGATGRSAFAYVSVGNGWAGVLANGLLLHPARDIAPQLTDSVRGCDVDGNGTAWVIAYSVFDFGSILGTTSDIRCRNLAVLGSVFTVSSQARLVYDSVIPVQPDNPAVGWLGDKYAVAWDQPTSGGGILQRTGRMKVISSSCEPCSRLYTFSSFNSRVQNVQVVGRASGTTSPSGPDVAALLFSAAFVNAPYESDTKLAQFRGTSDGTPVQILGGGCGGGGTIGQTGGPTVYGNDASTVTLTGADPSANFAFLWVALPAPLISCNSCMGINPANIVANYGLPVSGGAAAFNAPVPCLTLPSAAGLPLDFQWIVFNTSSSPCFFAQGLAVSDVMRATISE